MGRPEESACQLKRPVTICWETPATMKRPTPEPIPHFETTSSMKRIRTPPIHIWIKIIRIMIVPLTPREEARSRSG